LAQVPQKSCTKPASHAKPIEIDFPYADQTYHCIRKEKNSSCAMSSIYFDNELALNDYASVSCIAWSKGEAGCEMFQRSPVTVGSLSHLFIGFHTSFVVQDSVSLKKFEIFEKVQQLLDFSRPRLKKKRQKTRANQIWHISCPCGSFWVWNFCTRRCHYWP